MDSAEEGECFDGYLGIGLDELLQEGDISAHITERDHGGAIADQGVVGIVPLGSQGVHPYTGIGNEVRQFGE